jgi:hypothetical protein
VLVGMDSRDRRHQQSARGRGPLPRCALCCVSIITIARQRQSCALATRHGCPRMPVPAPMCEPGTRQRGRFVVHVLPARPPDLFARAAGPRAHARHGCNFNQASVPPSQTPSPCSRAASARRHTSDCRGLGWVCCVHVAMCAGLRARTPRCSFARRASIPALASGETRTPLLRTPCKLAGSTSRVLLAVFQTVHAVLVIHACIQV